MSTSCPQTTETHPEEARADDTGRTQRPIKMEVDLCLYRVVNERCGGRILPFGVRQMIKEYAFVKFDNDTLPDAVELWCGKRAVAIRRYGDINDWDVSQVTYMSWLFYYTTFNDRIDRWDVRNVTSMSGMFCYATNFNQPLDTWDVSHVTNMSYMFDGATSYNQPLAAWDVRAVRSIGYMFSEASSFNQPLDTWDVSDDVYKKRAFHGATAFHQSLPEALQGW